MAPWRLAIAPHFNPGRCRRGMAARGPEYQKADIPAGFPFADLLPTQGGCCDHFDSGPTGGASELSEELDTSNQALFAMRRSLQSEVPVAAAMENQTPRRVPPTPFTRVRQPITKTTKKVLWISMATGFTSAPWPLAVWVPSSRPCLG